MKTFFFKGRQIKVFQYKGRGQGWVTKILSLSGQLLFSLSYKSQITL